MLEQNYLTFETKLGLCAICWHLNSVTGFLLPEESKRSLLAKLKIMYNSKPSSSPPVWVNKLVRKLQLHFEGKLQDFSNVPIEIEAATDFTKSVYEVAKNIAPGEVVSYQEIGKRLGRPNASRAVGSALGKNPILVIVPCHRVITSSGKLGGFSAAGGLDTKKKLLRIEGVSL